MHKLRVTELDNHAQLLLLIGAASPAMAADYLSSCTLNVEPKLACAKWVVSMTLIGQMIEYAAKQPSGILQQTARFSSWLLSHDHNTALCPFLPHGLDTHSSFLTPPPQPPQDPKVMPYSAAALFRA